MRNDPVDPETLAALLDGKLSTDERERVLARLAKSEREYEDLLETVALVGALNEAPTIAAVPTPPVALVRDAPSLATPRKRSWRRPALVGPLIVAASLALVMVLRMKTERNPDPSLFAVIESAAGTERIRADWARTRGVGDAIAPEVLAFRLGAMFTDFDLASAANDSVAAREIASQIGEMALTIRGGGPTAVRLQSIASNGASAMSSPNERRKVGDDLRTLNGKGAWFDLGAWAQAARHAAHAGRAEFFLPNGTAMAELNRVLAAVERSPSNDATVRGAVQRLRNANPAAVSTPADVGVISAVLDSTVAEAGR